MSALLTYMPGLDRKRKILLPQLLFTKENYMVSGLYRLDCTLTTALRGFRLGARCAVVPSTTSGARQRPGISQCRPTDHFSRSLGASEKLADGPHRLHSPSCRGNGKNDRKDTI